MTRIKRAWGYFTFGMYQMKLNLRGVVPWHHFKHAVMSLFGWEPRPIEHYGGMLKAGHRWPRWTADRWPPAWWSRLFAPRRRRGA
jgi:hypothetical protein